MMWHTAYLPRTKKPVPLSDLLPQEKKQGIDELSIKERLQLYSERLNNGSGS